MRGRRGAGSAAAWLAAACFLFVVPGAVAAPPANDDFEDAQTLSGALPISLSTTNVEATKEPGEPTHGPFGDKGHSVWFEWEATSDGFVTVGTCGSDFRTVTAVYTGTELLSLTKVAGGFESEGPGCPAAVGQEVTFEATSGVTYSIALDGDPYFSPGGQPPVGQGGIALQLKMTPVPVNNDFSNATPLRGSITEEPGAEMAFYWASLPGSNWNADKEAGEPEHAGDPGGASVWYSWTAPESGAAFAGACQGGPLLAGIYTGASVGSLTPVGSDNFAPCGATFVATAGSTYWIAIDGKFSEGTASPAMRTFSVNVSMRLPPRPRPQVTQPAPAPIIDATPPNTTARKRVLKRMPPIFLINFTSSEPGSTFRCKLDRQRFRSCRSPNRFGRAAPGRHVFKVAATDPAGNVDPTPAVVRFTVPKARPRSD